MQLHIGNLPADTTEADLEKVISAVCRPQSITIIKDIDSGQPKGYATARVDDKDGPEAINRLNGADLKGNSLTASRMPETLPGEMELREWLMKHATEALRSAGLSEGQTVLDYGCGPGLFTLPAADIVTTSGQVCAFEANSGRLDQLKEKVRKAGLSNVTTVLADGSRMEIDMTDGSADVILVYDMMHEITDKQAFLGELHRVLRDSGTLSVFPMHMGTDSLLAEVEKFGRFCLKNRFGPPGFKTASEVINLQKC